MIVMQLRTNTDGNTEGTGNQIMKQGQGKPNAVSLMTAVNFSEMKISSNPAEIMVAFSICSGIGVTIHDSVCGVGGVLNFMLPDSTNANGLNPEKVPYMFADTGMRAFLRALAEQGCQPDRMKVVVAGGAQIMDQTGTFNIGQKNYEALKTSLETYDLKIHHQSIGGTNSRTLSLDIGNGCSCIKILGQGEERV